MIDESLTKDKPIEKSKTGSKQPSLQIIQKIKAYSLLAVLSLIWGVAFVAIRVADFELSPVNLTLLRWFIAGAGYLALLPFLGRSKTKFETKDLPRLLVVSFANVPAYHLSLNYAETTVSAGLAGLLISLGPVFIVVLSRISLKETIGTRVIIALSSATLGAALLSFSDLNGTIESFAGPIEVVITALAYAVFAVLSKPLVHKYGSLPIAIRAGTIGTVMLLPLLSQSFVAQVSAMSEIGWFSVLYLSLLSTVLGYSMFYTLVSKSAVSRLSIQLYLIPIVSVISGVVLLGEKVSAFTVVGGAALLFAIALATRQQSRR